MGKKRKLKCKKGSTVVLPMGNLPNKLSESQEAEGALLPKGHGGWGLGEGGKEGSNTGSQHRREGSCHGLEEDLEKETLQGSDGKSTCCASRAQLYPRTFIGKSW